MASDYRGAGVYLFRTRRPGIIGQLPGWLGVASALLAFWFLLILGYPLWPAALGLLLNSRHNAYVGETTAIQLRKSAHLYGSARWKSQSKPWADLEPSHYFLRLPGAPRWLLKLIETLGILLFWPVYNHQKNQWNPRRIPLQAAKSQRAVRDRIGWSPNFRLAHLIITGALAVMGWWSW